MRNMTPARLEREIEAVMRDRTGRECLYFPSGRLALLCALFSLVAPGAGILISPLTDDVIYFITLAAGLRPIMAPVSPRDGNIDPAAVPASVWPRVQAVVTTNLYGLPDRLTALRARCDQLAIPLIEDVAHAIESTVETAAGRRPVGTVGEVAAFSFSKHADAPGGALVMADPARREELARLRDRLLVPRTLRQRQIDLVKPPLKRVLQTLRQEMRVRRALRGFGWGERSAYRMELRGGELRQAVTAPPEPERLERFESWTRVDRHDYRMRQPARLLEEILDRVRALPSRRQARLDGVSRLAALELAAPGARQQPLQPLVRVPLLVERRDELLDRLARRGIGVWYVYDPPLDDYAGAEFAGPSAAPDAARWYARHVLPIDPRHAVPAVRALRELGATQAQAVPQQAAG